MKYYLIVGEASGDLHASQLMAALKVKDSAAEFRYYGGDLMQAQGGTLVQHYQSLAYMGFLQVALHARIILKGLAACKKDILSWQPDALILVDYPGFNLKIAKFAHARHLCPVVYYIAPKIWAWKEHRIKAIRRDIDLLLSILPFEKAFYEQKHHYPIHYVGNPSLDEVTRYQTTVGSLKEKPLLALLAGSRKQEIAANLLTMVKATEPWSKEYDIVLAGAPSIEPAYYEHLLRDYPHIRVVYNQTFTILSQATAALVTSGTATLETALFNEPQVVCYATSFGHIVRWLRPHFLKVKYISLVNLILNKETVPELVGADMNIDNCRSALKSILPGGKARQQQLDDYVTMRAILGEPGAPEHAAEAIIKKIG